MISVMKYSIILVAILHISCSGPLELTSDIERIFFAKDQVAFDDLYLSAHNYVQIEPDTALALYHEANADYAIPKGTTVQYVTLISDADTVLYYHYYYNSKDGCEGLPLERYEFHFDGECTASGFYTK